MRHDSEYFKKIGARLNEAMDEKNVTQRDIAELCGVSITTVHNYIHGIAAPNKKNIQNTAIKNLTLPAKTVKLGKQFVYKCSKMNTLTVKSSKMTKNTLADGTYKGINKSVVVKVPKSKVSAYTKLFQSKGLGKKVKVQKTK